MDYREAGVDISAADAAKKRIKALARSTFNSSVLTEIGSFGGMFRADLSRYREPALVASTDGVGTKIRVAVAAGVHGRAAVSSSDAPVVRSAKGPLVSQMEMRAIEALGHAREIDPGHVHVRDELARLLTAAGRPEEAAELLAA